ncbi:MAG: AtpZ/AtpI family protein [Planctomycetota bacterium]
MAPGTRYIGLGVEFAVLVGLGFFLGMKLDQALGLPPVVFATVLALLGAFIAFKDLFREVTRSVSSKRREPREPSSRPDDSGPRGDSDPRRSDIEEPPHG